LDGISLSENPLTTNKTEIITTMKERRRTEKDGKETYSAPIMLKKTGKNRIVDFRIASLETATLPSHELKTLNKPRLYPTRNRNNVKTLSIIDNGIVDKGIETPATKSNSLMKKPINTKKAKLRPTEKRMVSTILVFLSFKNLRRMKPGINVR